MGLPVKMIGVGIFKIMDGDNLCNVQFFGQRERLVSHGSSTPFTGKMSKYVFYDNSIKEKNKKSKFCANKSEFCANQKRKKHGNLKTTKNN